MKKAKELWVVKVGSQTIIEQGPLFIRSLCKDIAALKKKYHLNVLIVTSGAIATAQERAGKKWSSLAEKQALSAIGQPLVMDIYNIALQSQGLLAAQVLLTYSDFQQKKHRNYFRQTLRTLLDWGVVPILNENDAVATEEIQFGDNDILSALIASDLKSKRLILMTNVDGIYDRDPSQKDAELMTLIPKISKEIIQMQSQNGQSQWGRGGVRSKLLAAQKASQHGVMTSVVNAKIPGVLLKIANGGSVGTLIPPRKR